MVPTSQILSAFFSLLVHITDGMKFKSIEEG
jgi:hypothetical protein